MAWNDDLLEEQEKAAGFIGRNARLLAGPGTGKTRSLTRRICFLIEEKHVDNPGEIFVLTFTRAAAQEIRERVEAELGAGNLPRISTLHSFALRQLMLNSTRIKTLPQPLRIADDWDERQIILEDLKLMLDLSKIKEASNLLHELSADWQSLTADEDRWEDRFPNPNFLGAWREHRQIYGYVLRSELVYQLKRSLEQYPDFKIEGPPKHLLVDEYQDLNRCDLAIIHSLAERGAELFVAGDDDQSIYGFRKAHPEGIRRFMTDYTDAEPLELSICKRCDPQILNASLFVADQDYNRIKKPLKADAGRAGGEVALLRFDDQLIEAEGVGEICHQLVMHGTPPEKILILLRSDRNKIFSSLLYTYLQARGVPASLTDTEIGPFDTIIGRQILSILRLIENRYNHLAWRALIQLRRNHLGQVIISELYGIAKTKGFSFAEAIHAVSEDSSLLSKNRNRFAEEVKEILNVVDTGQKNINVLGQVPDLEALINDVIRDLFPDGDATELKRIHDTVKRYAPKSISELIGLVEGSDESAEQDIQAGKINILTMHKAKGLTAEAVFILAAEDELIPGRATGDDVDEERRLLYVSMTRAMHSLFITYCQRRTDRQAHCGRNAGQQRRTWTLCRFLRDAPMRPVDGQAYARDFAAKLL